MIDQVRYLIADVRADGSGTGYWSSSAGTGPKQALEYHINRAVNDSMGGSSHARRLHNGETVRFAVGPAKAGIAVDITSITFFDVSLGGVTIKAVGA